ncbi:histidine kinase [Streptosporangium sp. V21-05]|uniref:sensor histidine kinase n=1 Tax=Streptosporangium sp. V21-05 TaxID=3446115 RepID=UPI003F52D481
MPSLTALDAMSGRPLRYLGSAWPWRALAYLLISAGMGPVAAGLVHLAYERGVAVAVPVAVALVVVLAPWLARFERWRLRLVDRGPARDPHGPVSPGPPGRFRVLPRDQAGWRELGFAAVSVLALWWIDLGLVALGLWLPLALLSAPLQPSVELLPSLPFAAAGLVTLPIAAYPITAWAAARATVVRAVLAPREAEVIRSRARLADAFENERRRIERDLHDGAQQRLVALTMKLGLAELDLPPGSAAAVQVREAYEEANKALAELRELIRGVHPQVLADRGLPAAVLDVAGRSPVPVDVDIVLREGRRLPPAVEVTAYYVVSEALTNVAKHSGASRCRVRGRLVKDVLVLEIRDDGVGGADQGGGSGLEGLADRLAVVDGTMSLYSPAGGPTVLGAEIPCG